MNSQKSVRPQRQRPNFDLVLCRLPPWRYKRLKDWEVWYAGDIEVWNELADLSANRRSPSCKEVECVLSRQYSCFGLIMLTPDASLLIVDHIRSYPIYFVSLQDKLCVSDDPRALLEWTSTSEISDDGVREYLLSGYVHGRHTLFKELKQLRAGELMCHSLSLKKIVYRRYFKYLPSSLSGSTSRLSVSNLIELFDKTLNNSFSRAIDRANGRPIWVPLSGGLDSRLVVCKLLEHGCKNIQTFSYGVNNNHEMRMAKKIAKKLKISWIAVPSLLGNLRSLFKSQERREYAHLSDGLHMSPIYLDFEAIYRLVDKKYITDDAIIVNGYSGDFLFGGHIPEKLYNKPSLDMLVKSIVEKHCGHIRSPMLMSNIEQVEEKIQGELLSVIDDSTDVEQLCAAYEYWDWQERQAKAVVHGQRVYEYFGREWLLPFWDKELVQFWATVPLELRLNQSLHIEYLKTYNYCGVFDELRSANELWMPHWKWMPWIGKAIEITAGKQVKAQFYEYMFYFGYFRNQLGMFGHEYYKRIYGHTKRPRVVPLAAIASLEDLGISVSKYVDFSFDRKSVN